jgi:hypothetical protein
VIREGGEADSASKVALFGHVNDADYGVRNMVLAGSAGIRAANSFFSNMRFFKVLKVVVFFGEVVNFWTLPVRSREGSVLGAGFGYVYSAVFNG